MPYLQCFLAQSYLFYISKLDNVIYIDMMGVPSWHHTHHVVLFILTTFYLKQKIGIL